MKPGPRPVQVHGAGPARDRLEEHRPGRFGLGAARGIRVHEVVLEARRGSGAVADHLRRQRVAAAHRGGSSASCPRGGRPRRRGGGEPDRQRGDDPGEESRAPPRRDGGAIDRRARRVSAPAGVQP